MISASETASGDAVKKFNFGVVFEIVYSVVRPAPTVHLYSGGNMFKNSIRSVVVAFSFIIAGGFFAASFAQLTEEFINATNASIDTLRKRECTVTIKLNDQAFAGKAVEIKQLRNHFGFGASIGRKFFTAADSAKYGDAFRAYFDWATPENEMKWATNEEMDDYKNYEDADWLIAWCKLYDIKVRGHNLFWNEKKDWIPGWTMELDTAAFKLAMKRRITDAMTHFKGKIDQWDIINEIIHGDSQKVEVPGMLVKRSGDPDIFSWIFKEARAIDPDVPMAVNEFDVIETPVTPAKEYITEIKSIESKGGKIDIVGVEGHFNSTMNRTIYKERIDTVANAVTQPLWLTEVDFPVPLEQRADMMEELMRFCFAHPRIEGIVLWVWWQGNRWRDIYTSFLVDSNYTENELGVRWRTIRNLWKTNSVATTDVSGKVSFKGFHGKYVVKATEGEKFFADTLYLEPGANAKSVEIALKEVLPDGVIEQRRQGFISVPFQSNGHTIILKLPSAGNRQLFISTYTISGKLLSRTPVTIGNGMIHRFNAPSGCSVFRIGSVDKTLYTGMGVQLR